MLRCIEGCVQFQTLDDKSECVGIYCDGELFFNEDLPEALSRTWSYAGFLGDKNIEYAQLYCGGKSLEEVCPEVLRPRWEGVKKKYLAFLKSFQTSRVSLNKNCFYDLVPQKFLLEWCYVRDLICQHVFENYERPHNYDYLLQLTKAMEDIKYRRLNLKRNNLTLYRAKHRKFAKKLNQILPYCRFNINGTKTGRLTTFKDSFPILTLDKELRCVMEPQNDFFVELDFNAAELRTLLSLQGKKQPLEDMHAWNVKNVFNNKMTRDDAKKRIFAWLYNPESQDHLCEHFYDRQGIMKKYYREGVVKTYFGKEIPSEPRTALNYIIQSTCAENVLRQMIKVSQLLEGSESFVAFPIHDSIIIDLAVKDREKLPDLIKIFSETELGTFKTNISVGKNFGSLKKLEVKS